MEIVLEYFKPRPRGILVQLVRTSRGWSRLIQICSWESVFVVLACGIISEVSAIHVLSYWIVFLCICSEEDFRLCIYIYIYIYFQIVLSPLLL